VNYRDLNRKTALFFAIGNKHWEVANCLIERGASLDVRSASGQTPRSLLKAANRKIPERKRKRASPTPDSACPDAPTRIRFALWEWGQEDSDPQIDRTADNVVTENAEFYICEKVTGCSKRIRRMEREFCADHAHLHDNQNWYKALEPKNAANLVNVCVDDDKKYVNGIERLASAACPSGFTLPAVSRETRTVAGYVHATFDSEILKIRQCKVGRDHQGKGLGGLLLQAAEERARKLGSSFRTVKLTVLDSNEPAKKCYAKAGFNACWNLFDSFLVMSSVLDAAASAETLWFRFSHFGVGVILTYTAAEISPAFAASMKMLKLFRLSTPVEGIRDAPAGIMRVFRVFRELGNWAMMIIDFLTSLFGALILLGIIVYMFAVSLSMNTADWLLQQESAGMVDRMLYEDVESWFGSLGCTVPWQKASF
ncbi:unnamed protein product, partial [Symbiodinium sp. KB8]